MLKIKQLKGRINYVEALNKMNSKVLEVSEDIKNEEIWFLEHQSVFTAGSSTPKNFNENKINNIPVVFINRGGKITFHGPGQLIIYPILNIRKRKLNIIEYINKIEEIIIKVFKNNKRSGLRSAQKRYFQRSRYDSLPAPCQRITAVFSHFQLAAGGSSP